VVPKDKIAANGDYNLNGERYREGGASKHSFPVVALGDESLFRVESGGTPKSDVEEYWGGGIPWATLVDLPATDLISQITTTQRTISEKGLRESSAKLLPANSVVVSTRATIGRIAINRVPIATNQGFKNVVIEDSTLAVPEYVALAITRLVPTMKSWAAGGTFAELSKSKFCELRIPLPPLNVQKELVAEVEGYQKVLDGARAVLDNYRPHFPIHPDWPIVELGELCKPEYGFTEKASETGNARFIRITDIADDGTLRMEGPRFITLTDEASSSLLAKGDVLVARTGATYGKTMVFGEGYPAVFASYLIRLRFPRDRVDPYFYWAYAQSDLYWNQARALMTGGGQPQFNGNALNKVTLPLPPLATQQAIVADIKAEQALVTANRDLVARFKKKIETTLVRVWGDDAPAAADA
jgi:type I restriction enzyme M protein